MPHLQALRRWAFGSTLLLSLILLGKPCSAGPNAGGTLILHANPSLVYCSDQPAYCGSEGLAACDQAITSVTGAAPVIFFAIAAFPADASPRLLGVTFGVTYSPAVSLLDQDSCGNFELPYGNWPQSGSGTAVTFPSVRTDHLVPIYWFAGYNYDAPLPALFELMPHPVQGGRFADDEIPAVLDPILGYGAVGFDQDGAVPCIGGGPLPGACCFSQTNCTMLSEAECIQQGGVFLGEGAPCDPGACNRPLGACCVDGVCSRRDLYSCNALGGEFQGEGTSCASNPCAGPTVGACCYDDGTCVVQRRSECTSHEGVYIGNDTNCDPSPCHLGACCVPNGTCELHLEEYCSYYNGLYRGDDVPCDPDPCTGTVGACCYSNPPIFSCTVTTPSECVTTFDGEYQGDGTTCDPDPCNTYGACCLSPTHCVYSREGLCYAQHGNFVPNAVCDPNPCPAGGACCKYDGSCTVIYAQFCQVGDDGVYQGDGTTCDPNPCEQPGACCAPNGDCHISPEAFCGDGSIWMGESTPCDPNPCVPVALKHSTWGRVKATYR